MTTPRPESSTRERLLAAAIDEFSSVGFAGARVDAIARRAGCNKQLLYHHFKDKEGLYAAVIQSVLAENAPPLADTLAGVIDLAGERFRTLGREKRWMRMMEWEALERGDQPVVGGEVRRCHLAEQADRLRELQQAGVVRDDAPTELLLMHAMGMAMLPTLLPQIVRLLTGAPDDDAFGERYAAALRDSLARLLAPRPPGD